MEQLYWKVKAKRIGGTNPKEIVAKARDYSHIIESSTKRLAYIRSKYFKKQKVFLKYFWEHLYQSGGWQQRAERLSYFLCAIEVIENSTYPPISTKPNRNKKKRNTLSFRR